MKKILLSIALFSFLAAHAGQVSRRQAMEKAQQFLNQKGLQSSISEAQTGAAKARQRGEAVPDYYYVFNVGSNEGFVIVSGDDRTPAVLGYAEQGAFDVDKMPPALSDLLQRYAVQIEAIQQGKAQPAPRLATHVQVDEIVKTKWNQDSPYNDLCKFTLSSGDVAAVTGCVATAMAQAVYTVYHPEATTAATPSYQVNYNGTETYTFESVPAGTTFDWKNMKLEYSGSESAEEKTAVANLMMVCGRSVGMVYSNKASSAKLSDVPDALKNYFGYSKGVKHVFRSRYSDEDWDNLIYNEIASGRPVIYGGQTEKNEGHAFLVHGYADGMYIINWGWGGSYDGKFLLNDLKPAGEGIGGPASGLPFNYDQDAVIGLAKEDGSFSETVVLETTDMKIVYSTEYTRQYPSWGFGKSEDMPCFEFVVTHDLANSYDIECNLGLFQNGEMKSLLLDKTIAFENFSNAATFTLQRGATWFGGLTGTYQVIPVSRLHDTDNWLKNIGSDKYFVTAVITDETLKLYVGEPPATGIASQKNSEGSFIGRFDLSGRQVDDSYKGVTIIKLDNGQTQKIINR